MQIPRVGVENPHLTSPRFDDAWMAVAHVGHVVVGVEEDPSGLIVERLHPAADDLERLAVPEAQVSSKAAAAYRQGLRFGNLRRCLRRGRQAEQPRRIGAERSPDGALTGPADPGKVRAQPKQVEDHLEVEVGRPSAIDLGRANRPELLAGLHLLPHRPPPERLPGEMAVERVEAISTRPFVLQDQDRAIIERRPVVVRDDDPSREWRVDRRPCRKKEIHPQVHCPPLRPLPCLFRIVAEERRGVEQSCLVVAPQREDRPFVGHLLFDPPGERSDLQALRIPFDQRAGHAEVKGYPPIPLPIDAHHRGESPLRLSKPDGETLRFRHGGQSDRLPKHRLGHAPRNLP